MNNAERLKGLDEIAKDLGSLEYQAAKRGMYLTVHAIHRAKRVLKWESEGNREKALQADSGKPDKNEQ